MMISHTSGERVKKWTEKSLVNPEELGSYAEGDMLDPPGPRSRSALTDLATRWPNATVPFVLAWDFCNYYILNNYCNS